MRTPAERLRPGPTRGAGWALIALLALLAGSCGGGQDAPLPPSPQVVEVKMREYAFDYDRSIGPGRTVFRVHNTGRRRHDLVLIPLPQDLPPIDVQLRSKTRRVVAPLGRVRPLRPDASGTFAADLAPGRYGMVSFVTDATGTTDADKGMNTEFRVR